VFVKLRSFGWAGLLGLAGIAASAGAEESTCGPCQNYFEPLCAVDPPPYSEIAHGSGSGMLREDMAGHPVFLCTSCEENHDECDTAMRKAHDEVKLALGGTGNLKGVVQENARYVRLDESARELVLLGCSGEIREKLHVTEQRTEAVGALSER